ncbi:PAS domain-containing protein [Flagellimonas hymeniacidonis]|uniref:histidine kinase n=1 Tax=Flagellimonas hymeniacidonis TaxID=2603628 RepID=A0A5C8V5V6_9FLAO|nr:PAS domain-containing protein [Flagellimonas hymeniacidonis]TXN36756.1 PAS domain-containing protein [Flagellimonas hymeniacidonis]
MKATKTIPQHYLLKQLPHPTALLDLEHALVDASDSWIALFDKNLNDCIGTKIEEFYNKHEKVCGNSLEQCLTQGKTHILRHKKGKGAQEQWLESTFAPWFDEKENLLGTVIHTNDISSEIEKELELERVKTLLKTTSEVALVGSWEFDIATEKLSWCEVTKKIHEVSPDYEPDVNEGIEFYKQGYSRNKISMLFHKALEDGTPFSERLIIVTSKGKEKWVTAAGKPIQKNGKTITLFGTFQDINDQVLTEIKTKENEQLLTTLVDNLPINVFIKDRDSRKILVNKSECDYLGAKSEDLLGKTDFDLYEKDIAQISRDEDLEVMRTHKPMIGIETINVRKDGSATNFLTSKIPLLDIKGKAYGLIGMSMDITHIKQKEDQLQDLINVTAIQNKKLINFAHIVSHNLRSHTANFSMLLEFLINEKEEEEKKRIMKMLSHASDNLLDTLENLNEVVEISTNVNLDKKSLNLNEYIHKVQQNLAGFLVNNKVELINSVPKKLTVLSVPAYLESIILNLVTNAVKYSKPKEIPTISLSAKKQDKNVIFSVSDKGMGIDLNRYGGKIFGMYKTFHNNKDARGLGLYIIKNQAEAMGGNITVSSEVNKGTTFKVYFNEES